jgi:hypothetical protein
MKKYRKNINEQEIDPDDLNDFQKILALNKGKISTYEVDFVTSKGKDFGNVVVENDGLHFYFDDIEEFLKFFFPETYEEGTEGEYDASNYRYMLDGYYSWGDEYWDRSGDDWSEGYVVDRFNTNHKKILEKILQISSPSLLGKVKKFLNSDGGISNTEATLISKFLQSFSNVDDRLIDVYVDAQVEATSEATRKGIRDTYCDPFYDIGIENVRSWCFGEYVLPWGSAILLFARFGTDEDKLLDLLFESTEKTFRNHLPPYYELGYNFWDDETFHSVFDKGVTEILENLLEELQEGEEYSKKYLETVNIILNLGGFEKYIPTKDKKYEVMISYVDKETSKVTYSINKSGSRWSIESKKSKTDIESLLNFLNQQRLFDPLKENKTTFLKGDL